MSVELTDEMKQAIFSVWWDMGTPRRLWTDIEAALESAFAAVDVPRSHITNLIDRAEKAETENKLLLARIEELSKPTAEMYTAVWNALQRKHIAVSEIYAEVTSAIAVAMRSPAAVNIPPPDPVKVADCFIRLRLCQSDGC